MPDLRPPLWASLKPADLRDALRHPPDRYRPVPWLAWTGDLDWDVLRGQLADMKAKGIMEFFLFAIYGMEPPYMSALYWQRVRQTLDFCRENGMKCWIYDEYNWPSGVCAGAVLRDHPEAREKLLWVYPLGEDGEDSESPELPAGPGGATMHRAGDVAWGIAESNEIRINVQGCDWLSAMPGYLNVASPEACLRFLESTHERYFDRYADFFPTVVPGFFTDEPGPHVRAGGGWYGFVYGDGFFDDFAARYGYDLRERLADLLAPSPTARRTRCHFWRLLSELWGDAYAGQGREWCDAHGVAYTGHCLGEESLVTHVRMAGDLWEPLRHFTIPGIDMLSNADGFTYPYRTGFYGPIDRRAFHVTCKLVHGVCRQTGAKEMLSEAYGVCDWGMNLYRQKRGFNYQVALGVTLFNDNSLVTSIADFRKYAIAGKHFTQPWWQHYRQYADYNARVAAIHAEGETVADVAVLYPRSTVWAKTDAAIFDGSWLAPPEGHPLGALQEFLYDLLDEMIRGLWQFDFVFEPVLAAAAVEGDELVCEHTRYRALVVPSATDLPRECIDAIRAFAEAGGVVIFAGELPTREVESQADLSAGAAAILACRRAAQVPASGAAVCEALAAAGERPAAELAGDGSREFIASWRRLAGSDLLFVANMAEAPADVTVKPNLPGPFVVCDPDTLEVCRPAAANGHFEWHFEPWQAFVIASGPAAGPDGLGVGDLAPEPWWRRPARAEVLDGEWSFEAHPGNMLRLTYEVRPDPDNRGAAAGWQHDAGSEGWIAPEGRRLAEAITPGDSPWYWLRTRVICEAGAEPRTLVADNPDFLEAFVNGRPAQQVGGEPLWTEENVHFDVAGLFREGENWVHLRARTSKYNDPRISPMPGTTEHLLQPVVIVGSFAADEDGAVGRLSAWRGALTCDKPWEQLGLPHFAGTGVYRRTIDLPGPGRVGLRLPATTDAVEVLVNGASCGLRVWPPYVFDLTPALRDGANDLQIRVANTLGNIILETYAGAAPSVCPTSGLLAPPELLIF